jgi:hypothetical protein
MTLYMPDPALNQCFIVNFEPGGSVHLKKIRQSKYYYGPVVARS